MSEVSVDGYRSSLYAGGRWMRQGGIATFMGPDRDLLELLFIDFNERKQTEGDSFSVVVLLL